MQTKFDLEIKHPEMLIEVSVYDFKKVLALGAHALSQGATVLVYVTVYKDDVPGEQSLLSFEEFKAQYGQKKAEDQ
jgi:hypothetical protein